MISLKQQITEIDIQEQRFHDAFQCYLATLNGVGQHALDITPEVKLEFQSGIRALHRQLLGNCSVEALESTRGRLFELLAAYQANFRNHQGQQDEHLRSMIGSLATLSHSLSLRNDSDIQRWQSFTEKLQATASLTDLGQIKREIELRIEDMRSTSQSIWEENRASTSHLEGKLGELQTKLAEAEKRASTDALTGLLNRGGGEAALETGLLDGTIGSVMMIDLNGFKQINDRWGHECGDQVLQKFSRKLEQLLPREDSICRWGGDEFLILRRAAALPKNFGETLEKSLREEYKLLVNGKPIGVEVTASVGGSEAVRGQSISAIVSQADSNMYRHKVHRPVPRNRSFGALIRA